MSLQQNLTLLSPEKLPFSLQWLPENACLVGGAVRDALLNRQGDYLDLDFVLPELAVEIAQKIAQYYHAGFVILDEKRQIARVVFKQGTVDFAQQEGNSLEMDLRRRDFTINALAYNLHHCQLIDPLKGLLDLENRIIRMISPANLKDDPLRLLRAYRQAAQLDFSIDINTRSTIASLAHLIKRIAAERVQNELGYLLAIPQGNDWLMAAWQDGLLQPWFANATEYKLNQVGRIDQSVGVLQEMIKDSCTPNFQLSCQEIERAKLASLVSFLPEEAEEELINLKYSRSEIRTITSVLKALIQLQQARGEMSLRDQYFFFLSLGDNLPILGLLALALGISKAIIAPLIHSYLNPRDIVAHPQPLVRGNDLIKALHIPPSPVIGKLLTEIQIARIEGKILTQDDAIKFAKLFLITND
jgi:tRNA nucleotidyltransferase (CCA-adding enzyme)